MIQNVIPASIQLLQVIATKSNDIAPIFDPKSKEFHTLQKDLKPNKPFEQEEALMASPIFITYFQILMLLGLSMHEGIFIPSLKRITFTKDKLTIYWMSGVTDIINFGKFDTDFIKFASYLETKLFPRKGKTDVQAHFMFKLHNRVGFYLKTLSGTRNKINQILKGKSEVEVLLKDPIKQDLLFILLSSFPQDQINALFLYIQSFFPEDLTIRSKEGNEVRVISMFQTPSADINYLIEKIKVYFELYYDKKTPIIQHITQSKTREFILKLMENKAVANESLENLTSIKENQIDMRVNLYTLFSDHLQKIISI